MGNPVTAKRIFACVAFVALLECVRCYLTVTANTNDATSASLESHKNMTEAMFVHNEVLPLNELKIQSCLRRGPMYEKEWEFYEVNLNKGTIGRYLYVGYKRGNDHPITSIDFKSYGTRQRATIYGWEWSPVNLNRGTVIGNFIYMYWKFDEPGKQPITDLMFLAMTGSYRPAVPGYTPVGPDLNQGAGGLYIWAYYSNMVDPDSLERKRDTNGRTVK